MTKTGLIGLDKVMSNLNKEIKKIKNNTEAGLVAGAMLIKRDSMKNTPVITGNLKASAFVTATKGKVPFIPAFGGGMDVSSLRQAEANQTIGYYDGLAKAQPVDKPVVFIGHTAIYTGYVHEHPTAGKTGKPGAATSGSWKFLENAVKTNTKRILDEIKKRIVIK